MAERMIERVYDCCVMLEKEETAVNEQTGHSNRASNALHNPWSVFPINMFFVDNPVDEMRDRDCIIMQLPPKPRKKEAATKRVDSLIPAAASIWIPLVSSIRPDRKTKSVFGIILLNSAWIISIINENRRTYVQTSSAV